MTTKHPSAVPHDLKVGEIILPLDFREFEAALTDYNLRVTHVFKNGSIRAKTDSGNAEWNGKAEGFYRPTFATAPCSDVAEAPDEEDAEDGQLVTNVEELAELPDGTIISPTSACAWPGRYAGRRFQKRGNSVDFLETDPVSGERHASALLKYFRDPLPARVVGFEEIVTVDPADLFPATEADQA